MPRGILFRKILLYEYLGFGVLILFLWINELFDLPHHFFGSDATPINYAESFLETIILLILAIFVIRSTLRLLKQIEKLAMFDPLTKLVNRECMREFLEREINRSSRSRKPFSLIMGDIDHFKQVNDQYGHVCGDRMLQHIAAILKKNLRAEDVICRWGGQEFLLLLPETLLEGGQEVAEKVRKKIEESPLSCKDQEISVTMSFGVCSQTLGDRNLAHCINEANRRLYEAKKNGRNRVA